MTTIETIADTVEIIRFATFGSLRVALYWSAGDRFFSVAVLLDDGEWHADCPIRLIDFVSIDEREVADCWSKSDAELAIARFIEHRSQDS